LANNGKEAETPQSWGWNPKPKAGIQTESWNPKL